MQKLWNWPWLCGRRVVIMIRLWPEFPVNPYMVRAWLSDSRLVKTVQDGREVMVYGSLLGLAWPSFEDGR